MGPLVHGHAGQLVGEFLSVGDFGISGVSRGLYPGLPLTGDRRHRIRHLGLPEVVESLLVGCRLVFVLFLLSRSCSGSVLSPRFGLSALDRCARSCRWGCLVDGDFHLVNGRRLCRNLPSQYPVCRDLLVLLVHFVGGPLSWVGSLLLHLSRNQK